jgi:hypothetical protein
MEEGGQLHAPVALPPGKEPLYPLDRRLGATCGELIQNGLIKIIK